MSLSHLSVAARTLNELLYYHDEHFIQSAFQTVLNREPDDEGMRFYLASVRAGVEKMEILSQLYASSEGRERQRKLEALDEAIDAHQRLKAPLLGPIRRVVSTASDSAVSAAEGALYALEPRIKERFTVPEEQFLHCAYHALLARPPDLHGLRSYIQSIQNRVAKVEILAQIKASEEGKSRIAEIARVNQAIRRHRQMQLPLLGIILRLARKKAPERVQIEYLRAMENSMHLLNKSQAEMRQQLLTCETKLISLQLSGINVQQNLSAVVNRLDVPTNQHNDAIGSNNTHVVEPSTVAIKSPLHQLDSTRHPAFDEEWYLSEYPDVADSGMDPYEHYLSHGKKEGHTPAFDSDWYLSEYPDVKECGMSAREHYAKHGKAEGRHPAFNEEWYLNRYPDVETCGVDAYTHYLEHGKAEGRLPAYSPFNTDRNNYPKWILEFDTLTHRERSAMRTLSQRFNYKPLISIVMPVYNPNPIWLKEVIESVRKQIYLDWELCIADDASTNSEIRPILERYAREDRRIKVTFREKNGHISAASNSALSLAQGEWIALLDHDDLLAENALFWVADAINKYPAIRLIYSDEDKIDENGVRSGPYFKCDWNPDLFYSHNLITHLGVYHAELVNKIEGFRIGFEGSQDYDLALRCIEQIAPSQIHHIPRVLYHWRMHAESTAQSSESKPYAMIAGERAINEHFQRLGVNAKAELEVYGYRVRYALPKSLPLVSLIIPTRNGLKLLKQCIESILTKTTYSNYEILIMDNGSDDPATLLYLQELGLESRIRVIRDDRPFNYSALNNAAVKLARGEIVGLINNDIEVISLDWLSEMVGHALRPEVGAVGARLWYANDTLQHGGVIISLGGVAAHSHKHLQRGSPGYVGRASLTQSLSAVTAACLLIRKSIFNSLGGLNEIDLQIAYNDVDFCLRVRDAGYRNIWTPYAELYHHESATRGYEDTPEKKARFEKETAYMKRSWGKVLHYDPAYSPNLTLDYEDFSFAWPPRVESIAEPKYS
jgi:glycosyltransferase involved in cell wall biosynthesis